MDRLGLNQPFLVKKSPVVIVKNFIVLQMAAVAVFFFSAVMLDYGEIYEHYMPLAGTLSFHIVEAIGLFALETCLVFYIFFRWYKESYDIQNDKIIHGAGIVFRRRKVIPLGTVGSINYKQGPLARLTKYGHIELEVGASNIVMDHIPEPKHYAELIANLKNNIKANGLGDVSFSIKEIILRGEHERLEFKTSFRWDLNQNKVNKNLEKAALKTIAAFLNSGGGQLIIGVDDSGKIVGLENDYKSLPKPNADGFQNHFNNVFNTMLGPEFRPFVELTINKEEGVEFCRINVLFANKPAYLRFDEQEEFFIRTGNGTTSLKLSETASYVDSHWRGKLV